MGTDELLIAVAKPEQIAALSHLSQDPVFSAVAEEAKRYPQLRKNGDVESVLKHRPTVALFSNYSRTELVTQVERAGVKVLIFDRYRTIEDVYENLRRLGRELGTEAKAEEVIADCQRRIAALRQKLRNVRPVRVIAPSIYGLIPGDDSTFQELCDYAVADNLAGSLGGLHGHEPPPNEQMLHWPIDRVVVAGDQIETALAPFKQLPPYKYMQAVKQNRAALLKPYQLSCVSHYRVNGYEQLARQLHPEVFP